MALLVSAKQICERSERRGDNFLEQIGHGFADDEADIELWIVHIAVDRDGGMNNPLRVCQQRHRKIERQLERSRRVDGFTECQFVDGDIGAASQLPVLYT